MKNILVLIYFVFILLGCGQNDSVYVNNIDFIIAGQSNANRCDWSYFENKTGYKVASIAKGGHSIDMLIDVYPGLAMYPNKTIKKPLGIIFIHGESDINTDPDYYISKVEQYRQMMIFDVGHNLPLYISTVGYSLPEYDDLFDKLRNAVLSNNNPDWTITFNDAQYFRDWGMLEDDNIHFNKKGCEL